MIDHFQLDGVLCPAYDGMMYPKSLGSEPDLEKLENVISLKMNINVHLKIKAMDMGFPMPADDELPKYVDIVDKYTELDFSDMKRGHMGMADVFCRHNKDVMITSADTGTGYIYREDTALWEFSIKDSIVNYICELLEDVAIEMCDRTLDENEKKECVTILKKVRDGSNDAHVYKKIRGKIFDGNFPVKLNREPHLFPIANKLVINLITGKTEPRLREHMFSMESPVSLVSDDIIAKCKVEKFMSTIMNEDEKTLNDQSLTYYIQRLLGVCLSGVSTGQLYIWKGKGQNGKSAVMDIMAPIMGDFMTTLSRKFWVETVNSKNKDAADHNSQFEPVINARLTMTSELHEGDKLNDEVFKNMVDGMSDIGIRLAHARTTKFRPICKNIILTNYHLKVPPSEHSIVRRIGCIPSRTTFLDKIIDNLDAEEEEDLDVVRDDLEPTKKVLGDSDFANSFKLGEARDAFLSWIVKGSVKHYNSEYAKKNNNCVQSVPLLEAYKTLAIASTDPLSRFRSERVTESKGSVVSVTAFYNALAEYTIKVFGYKLDYAVQGLGKRMEHAGIVKKKSTTGMVYVDIVVSDGMGGEVI
jgi:phage/plasmid-associated DNA primase